MAASIAAMKNHSTSERGNVRLIALPKTVSKNLYIFLIIGQNEHGELLLQSKGTLQNNLYKLRAVTDI